MLGPGHENDYRWHLSGREVFPAMLNRIGEAGKSVRLESYIFQPGALGESFRAALVAAACRGVRVSVLIDALGSFGLPGDYWAPLEKVGGRVRLFNPIALRRLGIRNHRKLLVCDDRIAFVGGFNIAQEYDGDGVTQGWCDLGMEVHGDLATQLALSFDEMFERADFQHRRFVRFRRSSAKRSISTFREQVLLSGPGRGRSPIKDALLRDLRDAREVRIMVAYFLPSWRIRRALFRVARRGSVQLILAGRSDIAVSKLAGQALYPAFLRAGVELFEYQPQVLHAKLILVDDALYVGSANLDQRSLNINYELMVRFEDPNLARRAREVFSNSLAHSRRIGREEVRNWTLWSRLKQRLAYSLLVRIDPYVAHMQWRWLPR